MPDLSTPEAVRQAMLNSRAIALATPGVDTERTHMAKVIDQLGLAEAMKGKLIHRPALEGGVQLVASGGGRHRLYPKSEVINIDGLGAGRTIAGGDPTLDDDLRRAIATASASPDAAAAFIAFVIDPAKSFAWQQAGFDPPACGVSFA